jgi:hypothetical protein
VFANDGGCLPGSFPQTHTCVGYSNSPPLMMPIVHLNHLKFFSSDFPWFSYLTQWHPNG